MPEDSMFMQRCIDLARRGLGRTAPNPMVGAVLVHQGRILGEGYHHRFGDHHAEVMAIEAVKERELIPKSSLYVSLEPCCHHGKTPPCTDLILREGIRHVVIGAVDPFDRVAGKGIARLRSKGCKVQVGLLKEECRQLNKRFFTFYEKKRPYIILKWAQTADGFIDMERPANACRRPTWITSEKLRMLVHKWRSEESVIMVGTTTALKDDPQLNVRDWAGPSPLRIVLDKSLRLPASLKLLDDSQPTLVINEVKEDNKGQTRLVKMAFDGSLLKNILELMYREGRQSLFVEGGRELLQSFMDQNLWDEARVFAGRQFFGKGIRAPQIPVPRSAGSQILIGKESFFCFRNQ